MALRSSGAGSLVGSTHYIVWLFVVLASLSDGESLSLRALCGRREGTGDGGRRERNEVKRRNVDVEISGLLTLLSTAFQENRTEKICTEQKEPESVVLGSPLKSEKALSVIWRVSLSVTGRGQLAAIPSLPLTARHHIHRQKRSADVNTHILLTQVVRASSKEAPRVTAHQKKTKGKKKRTTKQHHVFVSAPQQRELYFLQPPSWLPSCSRIITRSSQSTTSAPAAAAFVFANVGALSRRIVGQRPGVHGPVRAVGGG